MSFFASCLFLKLLFPFEKKHKEKFKFVFVTTGIRKPCTIARYFTNVLCQANEEKKHKHCYDLCFLYITTVHYVGESSKEYNLDHLTYSYCAQKPFPKEDKYNKEDLANEIRRRLICMSHDFTSSVPPNQTFCHPSREPKGWS